MTCKWHIQAGTPSIQPPRGHLLRTKDPKSVIVPTFKLGEQGDNRTTLKRTNVLKSTDKVLGDFNVNYK